MDNKLVDLQGHSERADLHQGKLVIAILPGYATW